MTQHDPDEPPDTLRQHPVSSGRRHEIVMAILACKERLGQHAAVGLAANQGYAMELIKLAEFGDALEGLDAQQ